MKYICQTEAVALYLQKYIVYRKRKISFADGSFTNFIELIIKHKEEKFMLALSEPHKPELPETLAKLKLQFSPVILARTVAADLNELDIKKFDLLALYSPSDVKAILERFPAEELPAVATFGEGMKVLALLGSILLFWRIPHNVSMKTTGKKLLSSVMSSSSIASQKSVTRRRICQTLILFCFRGEVACAFSKTTGIIKCSVLGFLLFSLFVIMVIKLVHRT